MAHQSESKETDTKRIQLVITADCNECPPSTSGENIDVGSGQRMVRAKIHALVPEGLCFPSVNFEQQIQQAPPSPNPSVRTQYQPPAPSPGLEQCAPSCPLRSPPPGLSQCAPSCPLRFTTPIPEQSKHYSKTEAITQTRETRMIYAEELEKITSGKRGQGFSRQSDIEVAEVPCQCKHCRKRQKRQERKEKKTRRKPKPKPKPKSKSRCSRCCRPKTSVPPVCDGTCRAACNTPPPSAAAAAGAPPCCMCGCSVQHNSPPPPKPLPQLPQEQFTCPRCKQPCCKKNCKSGCVIL